MTEYDFYGDPVSECECKEEYGIICGVCRGQGATSPSVVYPDDLEWQREQQKREEEWEFEDKGGHL